MLKEEGTDWYKLVTERCPYLFSDAIVSITAQELQQMKKVIMAIDNVLATPHLNTASGVFFGYDFHLNDEGVHLIEVNTNAGGAFLNALLIRSQMESDLENVFIAKFFHEWKLEKAEEPLSTIAIVDESPQEQFLYPEFLLAKKIF